MEEVKVLHASVPGNEDYNVLCGNYQNRHWTTKAPFFLGYKDTMNFVLCPDCVSLYPIYELSK